MGMSFFLKPLVLLGIFAASGVTDAAFHKIYNNLILTGFLLIFLVHITEPPAIDPFSLTYSICFILILLIFFSLKMLGGGDVKLYLLTIFAYPDYKGWSVMALSVIVAALTLSVRALKGFLSGRRPKGPPVERQTLKIHTQGLPMAVFIFAASCMVLLPL